MSIRLQADIDPSKIRTLIAILRQQGILHLIASPPPAGISMRVNPVELLLLLYSCNIPLVEHAVISLLILHPELASAVQEALRQVLAREKSGLSSECLRQRRWAFRPLLPSD